MSTFYCNIRQTSQIFQVTTKVSISSRYHKIFITKSFSGHKAKKSTETEKYVHANTRNLDCHHFSTYSVTICNISHKRRNVRLAKGRFFHHLCTKIFAMLSFITQTRLYPSSVSSWRNALSRESHCQHFFKMLYGIT